MKQLRRDSLQNLVTNHKAEVTAKFETIERHTIQVQSRSDVYGTYWVRARTVAQEDITFTWTWTVSLKLRQIWH